jgi:DNA-binding MarR family transcriptional regulator
MASSTPSSASSIASGRLALELLLASDAFNDELLKRITSNGWPPITKNQSLVFAYLSPDGSTASELARRIGITRQSMHKLLEHLLDEKLIRIKSHPDDARSSLVVLTAKGHRLMSSAQQHLADIEGEVASRIGTKAMQQLRAGLAHDWSTIFLD